MEIVAHIRELEVSIEDIPSHIMGIGARESNTINTIDIIDFFEKFTKWSLENLLCKGGARRAEDFYLLYYIFIYSFQIFQYLIIRKTNYRYTYSIKIFSSFFVIFLNSYMTLTINLNNQIKLITIKIYNIIQKRFLSEKSKSSNLISIKKRIPNSFFWSCHIFPEFFCFFHKIFPVWDMSFS